MGERVVGLQAWGSGSYKDRKERINYKDRNESINYKDWKAYRERKNNRKNSCTWKNCQLLLYKNCPIQP